MKGIFTTPKRNVVILDFCFFFFFLKKKRKGQSLAGYFILN